jgi:predicted nucleic acid-binding protein
LRRVPLFVAPKRTLQRCSGKNDNKFLECAWEARANYVVTGKVRHFPARFQDIRAILPAQFLMIFAAEPHRMAAKRPVAKNRRTA